MGTAYTAAKLTLTAANTPYSLYSLMSAIDSTTPIRACLIKLQSDDSNTYTIMIGDKYISTSRYGAEVVPNISSSPNSVVEFRADRNILMLKDIYFNCTGAGQQLLANIWTG